MQAQAITDLDVGISRGYRTNSPLVFLYAPVAGDEISYIEPAETRGRESSSTNLKLAKDLGLTALFDDFLVRKGGLTLVLDHMDISPARPAAALEAIRVVHGNRTGLPVAKVLTRDTLHALLRSK